MPRAHLIEAYRNLPGGHCGSTAMRNLLFHYCGLGLTEGEVFGLGSGIDFVLLESDLYQPGVMLFGRGATGAPPSTRTDPGVAGDTGRAAPAPGAPRARRSACVARAEFV